MRACVGVNWFLGCSSRNAKAVKKTKRAWIAYLLMLFYCFLLVFVIATQFFLDFFWFFLHQGKNEQIKQASERSIEKCEIKPY